MFTELISVKIAWYEWRKKVISLNREYHQRMMVEPHGYCHGYVEAPMITINNKWYQWRQLGVKDLSFIYGRIQAIGSTGQIIKSGYVIRGKDRIVLIPIRYVYSSGLCYQYGYIQCYEMVQNIYGRLF
jgi:hypothetical protein